MFPERAEAMHRICFDMEPSESDLGLLGSRDRWLVYRDLVRSRLTHIVAAALPRTKNAIGEHAFGRAVDEWLSTGGPKTRYLRHVPAELATFAIPVWRGTEAPWVADLASYELAAWNVRHAPRDPSSVAEFAFDRKPVITTAIEVLRLTHPVHDAPTPALGYERGPVWLCVYRDATHQPITTKLNAIAADLLDAWQRADRTVAQSVEQVAAAHETGIGPAFVVKLATLIADFIDRRIILGGQSPPRDPGQNA